jgi:hypothetical protein
VDGARGLLGGVAQLLYGVIDSPPGDPDRLGGRGLAPPQPVRPRLPIGAPRPRDRAGGDGRGPGRCGRTGADVRAGVARRSFDLLSRNQGSKQLPSAAAAEQLSP